MMPINLTRTNLLVYSCFWLFFSSTNMLAFFCLVTILASQCLLTEGRLCFFLTIKFVPSSLFLRVGWASPAYLAGVLLESYHFACRGRNDAGSDPSMSSPSALFWVYVLESLCVLGQAVKALAALSWRGGCVRRAGSALPAHQQSWPGVPWRELKAFLWSSLVKVKPLISRCRAWPLLALIKAELTTVPRGWEKTV